MSERGWQSTLEHDVPPWRSLNNTSNFVGYSTSDGPMTQIFYRKTVSVSLFGPAPVFIPLSPRFRRSPRRAASWKILAIALRIAERAWSPPSKSKSSEYLGLSKKSRRLTPPLQRHRASVAQLRQCAQKEEMHGLPDLDLGQRRDKYDLL